MKRYEKDFQDDNHGGHLEFSIRTNLGIFDLQVIPILPIKFPVNWPFQKYIETDFQDGGHLGFQIGMILAISDLQVAPILPTKFRSQLAFRFRRRSTK